MKSDIERYRDDGELARTTGLLGRAIPVPPLLLLLAGALPVGAAVAATGDGASDSLLYGAILWLVFWGGLSSGRPYRDRIRWAVPPVLRLAEYSTVVWVAANAGDSSLPAAFAFLSVLAFRHYDLVYRLRHQGVAPPDWLGFGGWDGRLILVALFLIAGWLPAALFVAAGAMAVVLVSESAASWVRFTRAAGQAGLYDDEEDEIQ
jgi:hypothetical protein